MKYYDPTEFETWRPNYEMKQTLAWTAGAMAYLCAGMFLESNGIATVCAACCGLMALSRVRRANRRYKMTKRLAGTPIPFIDFDELKAMMGHAAHGKDMWIGKGFTWGPAQTHRISEIMKMPAWDEVMRDVLGPVYVFRFLKKNFLFTVFHPFKSRELYLETQKRVADQPGYTWIHGVGEEEEDKFVPISHLEGHTFIVGTTGSGKTRCFDLLISQAILRGETVFIIDPKGDRDMMEKAKRACQMLGRADKFVSFHPAFPQESIKIDLLANWTRQTDLADRIASLLPGEGTSASFQAFCFWAIKAICSGLCYIYKKPTLRNIKHYLTGSTEEVIGTIVKDVLEAYVRQEDPIEGNNKIRACYQAMKPEERTATGKAMAMIGVYNTVRPSADIDDLLGLFSHPREHFGKMITSLLPIMTMLTSGQLGDMLSPDDAAQDQVNSDWNDTRSLIDSNRVVYIGLDSLSSPMVGAAIGSLFLADLTSVAGSRYNYNPDVEEQIKRENLAPQNPSKLIREKTIKAITEGDSPSHDEPAHDLPSVDEPAGDKTPSWLQRKLTGLKDSIGGPQPPKAASRKAINLFIDEASEVANRPFLQLLNKGRGAGFRLFVATQTVADFEAKMGSSAAARQFISNMNNKICLRTVDPDTQEFLMKALPKTKIQTIDRNQGLSTTNGDPVPTGGSLSERITEQEASLFPPELLGMLPNLEYIAIVSSGHVIKGRYPLILKDKSEYRPS